LELGTCLRIRRLGWRVVYDPELLVDHYADDRIDEPQRASRSADRIERDAYNELYELVRWLPWWQAFTATTRALTIGSKELPGFAVAIWLAAHGRPRSQVRVELQGITRARLRAVTRRPWRDRWDANVAPAQDGSAQAAR